MLAAPVWHSVRWVFIVALSSNYPADQVLPVAEKFCLDTTGVSVGPPPGEAQAPAPAFAYPLARAMKRAAAANPAPGNAQPGTTNTVLTPTTTASAIGNPPPATSQAAAANIVGAALPAAVGSFYALGAALAPFIV
jgi:hypothetical protein